VNQVVVVQHPISTHNTLHTKLHGADAHVHTHTHYCIHCDLGVVDSRLWGVVKYHYETRGIIVAKKLWEFSGTKKKTRETIIITRHTAFLCHLEFETHESGDAKDAMGPKN